MIIGSNTVVFFYEYFYKKKYNTPKYKFKPTSTATTRISYFIESLDKQYDLNTLGLKFLGTYFMFQFNRTHRQVFNRFASRDRAGDVKVAGRIQIYDIIGKKALQYWNERDIKFDFILSNCDFAKEHQASYTELRSLLDHGVEGKSNITRSEEVEKRRFYNSPYGLANCLQSTTLYNHRSQNCLLCHEKSVCKELLKINYNHIYVERGYGETV